jgi:hypothetical protein
VLGALYSRVTLLVVSSDALHLTRACVHPALRFREVIKKLVAALRKWTTIAMVWVKVIIHLAAEIVWTMEPRAGCDENSAAKPLGSTVPIWGAVVRREVVVIIWAG